MGLPLAHTARWRRLIRRHRRPIAAALAALCVLSIIGATSESAGPTRPVVVASRDIPAGTTLAVNDMTVVEFPMDVAPPGTSTDSESLLGQVVTVAVAPGEAITTTRLLGSRPEAGQGMVASPVRLADAGVAGLLVPGDVIDVIAATPDGQARIVARDARVITRPIPPATFGTQTGSLVLLSVTPQEATALAGVAATRELSAVLQ